MTWLIERRLTDASARLKRAREELGVLDEQIQVIVEETEDLRIRALVAETPQALSDHSMSQRHVDAMRKARADVLKDIDSLTKSQDDLLDQLSTKSSSKSSKK